MGLGVGENYVSRLGIVVITTRLGGAKGEVLNT